jgi:hypothetical protein
MIHTIILHDSMNKGQLTHGAARALNTQRPKRTAAHGLALTALTALDVASIGGVAFPVKYTAPEALRDLPRLCGN